MALSPEQKLSADVLALRIILGQMIVRIAAGAQDPGAVIKILRDSSIQTGNRAKLRGLADEKQEEVRKFLEDSIDRFFTAMRIEKGPKPGAAPAAPKAAAPAAQAKPAAKAPAAPAAAAKPAAAKAAAAAPKKK